MVYIRYRNQRISINEPQHFAFTIAFFDISRHMILQPFALTSAIGFIRFLSLVIWLSKT